VQGNNAAHTTADAAANPKANTTTNTTTDAAANGHVIICETNDGRHFGIKYSVGGELELISEYKPKYYESLAHQIESLGKATRTWTTVEQFGAPA